MKIYVFRIIEKIKSEKKSFELMLSGGFLTAGKTGALDVGQQTEVRKLLGLWERGQKQPPHPLTSADPLLTEGRQGS